MNSMNESKYESYLISMIDRLRSKFVNDDSWVKKCISFVRWVVKIWLLRLYDVLSGNTDDCEHKSEFNEESSNWTNFTPSFLVKKGDLVSLGLLTWIYVIPIVNVFILRLKILKSYESKLIKEMGQSVLG